MSYEELFETAFNGTPIESISDYDYLLGTTFTVAQIEAGFTLVLTFFVCAALFFAIFKICFFIIRWSINRIAEKMNGYHRIGRKWYIDELPVNECPICRSRARINFTNKRFRQGYIYCPHCYIRTNVKYIHDAVATWNLLKRDVLEDPDNLVL